METVAVFAENGGTWLRALSTDNLYIDIQPIDSAANHLDRRHADLVVIDCDSDTDSGLRLLRSIKQRRSDLPVIFITAVSSEETVVKAFRSGARDCFRKPVGKRELGNTISTLLKLKRGAREKRASLETERADSGLPNSLLPENIQRAVMYINDNLLSDIRLDTLAQMACISKYHFCRVFKDHLGLSPMQFLASRRVALARQLVCTSGHAMSVITFKAGFNNLSDFNRQFKKFTGQTPTAYKRSQRTD